MAMVDTVHSHSDDRSGNRNKPAGMRPARRPRRLAKGLFVVAVLAAIGLGIWSFRAALWPSSHADLVVGRAKIGTFIHDVVERGEVESSANVNVICEVQSQNSEGVRILQIVDEGTLVKKGDFLVKLDDSVLRTNRATQQIAVNTAAAALSQAQNELEAFTIGKLEYEFGTFRQDEAALETALLVAKENIRRALDHLKYSQKMAARGYIDRLKLEADQFAVEKNQKELEVAEIKLDVIRTYTKPKTLKKHESDIKTAEAKVSSEGAKHQIELEKLAQIESQIEKCSINAPIAGQVVYPEMERWRSNDENAIRAGTRVREQQVIIRLPDPKQMQVKARISESRVDLVKPGMKVNIRLDALPALELRGVVKTVNPYPSSDNWFNSNVKEYATYIEIHDPPNGLRSGMSSHVAIRVKTQPNALQVPVQAAVERGGKYYCVVRDDTSKLSAREVLIGSTNEKFLVIREGLNEQEEVVMNPRAHLEDVGLPAVDIERAPVEPAKVAARDKPQKTAQNTASGAKSEPSPATSSGPES